MNDIRLLKGTIRALHVAETSGSVGIMLWEIFDLLRKTIRSFVSFIKAHGERNTSSRNRKKFASGGMLCYRKRLSTLNKSDDSLGRLGGPFNNSREEESAREKKQKRILKFTRFIVTTRFSNYAMSRERIRSRFHWHSDLFTRRSSDRERSKKLSFSQVLLHALIELCRFTVGGWLVMSRGKKVSKAPS